MYIKKLRDLLWLSCNMLPLNSTFNLYVRSEVMSCVHYAIWSARHSCLLKPVILLPAAFATWHPRARMLELCCESGTPENMDFFQEVVWYHPLSVIHCAAWGKMENINGNQALIGWCVLQNPPVCDCDWLKMVVFRSTLRLCLLIFWVVLCYSRLCYK